MREPCIIRSSRLLRRLTAALFVPMVCALPAALAHAQSDVGTNIPVLVVGEDEDPTTVKRSSDIFKRVLAELKGSMQRHGFRMIDEESVAVDLGWTIADRRSKAELIEAIKLMSKSRDATHQVRAWVLFRIHAQAKQLSFSTKVQTRIVGEVYDAASNQFLDTFEMPREEYPAPADCLKQPLCINEVVGDRAREIAAGLGEVLSRKLERYSPPAGGDRGAPAWGGVLTPYTVTLRHFGTVEALTVMGVMAEEFPGYGSHNLINASGVIRRYEYVSTATAAKLEEWLYILLRDMGFDVEREVLIRIQGAEVTVEKLVPTPSRPESADERKRFN